MRSVLYGLLGVAVGTAFCVTLITSVPQFVTRTATTVTNQEQNVTINEETSIDYSSTQKFASYRVTNEVLENYKNKKVIEYGRINPMLYFKNTPVETPTEDEFSTPTPTEIPAPTENPTPTPIPTETPTVSGMGDGYRDINVIGNYTDEVDTDMDTSVVEFDWKGYESSYVLPRGYLFGYNTETKKLSVVDVATLEGDVMFNGQFPVDKEFYATSSNFGIRVNPFDSTQKEFHKGLDISTENIEGAKVYAMLDGVITQASDNEGYGNYVVIDHGKYSTVYAHLGSFVEGLKNGDKVKAGDVIGYVGNTGRSTGPHLHIEFDIDGVKITPKHFLNLILARK